MPTPKRSLHLVLWVNASLLAAIALILLSRQHDITPTAPAFGQLAPPPAAPNSPSTTIITPAQLTRDTFGCYLVDTDSQTLCVYAWDDPARKLKLLAARSFRYDRKLQNFNTENPSPAEVRDLVEREATTQP